MMVENFRYIFQNYSGRKFFWYRCHIIILLSQGKILKLFICVKLLVENIPRFDVIIIVIMFCPLSDIKKAINSLFSLLDNKNHWLEQNFDQHHCRKNIAGVVQSCHQKRPLFHQKCIPP